MIVTRGVPVTAVTSGSNLEIALQHGNHNSVTERVPGVWGKIDSNVRRKNSFVIRTSDIKAAHETLNLRVSPLATVVTHTAQLISALSFDVQAGRREGIQTETLTAIPPPDVCAQKLCAHVRTRTRDLDK